LEGSDEGELIVVGQVVVNVDGGEQTSRRRPVHLAKPRHRDNDMSRVDGRSKRHDSKGSYICLPSELPVLLLVDVAF
jgi:hypothetical protein